MLCDCVATHSALDVETLLFLQQLLKDSVCLFHCSYLPFSDDLSALKTVKIQLNRLKKCVKTKNMSVKSPCRRFK